MFDINKILFATVSFLLCALLGLPQAWLCFTFAFLLFSYSNAGASMIWEIPMGCVAADIVLHFCGEYEGELFRWLMLAAAGAIALFAPKKLLLFFPLAIVLLLTKVSGSTGTVFMAGALWSGMRCAFTSKRFFYKKYC